jgi:thiamine-phosphate pyrophosphorylase
MTPGLLRIFDANLNRATEGLRLLEDVARFILNDYELTQSFRDIRHALAQSAQPLDIRLLSERDAEHDIGKPIRDVLKKQGIPDNNGNGESNPYAELTDTIAANARRVEQALRVMEELSRLSETEPVLDTASFARARFDLYALGKKLSSGILRQKQASYLEGLYVILDKASLGEKTYWKRPPRSSQAAAPFCNSGLNKTVKRNCCLLPENFKNYAPTPACFSSSTIILTWHWQPTPMESI